MNHPNHIQKLVFWWLFLVDKVGSCQRQMCECDRNFAISLGQVQPNEDFFAPKLDTDLYCRKAFPNGNGSCCQSPSGLFTWYNSNQHDCCSSGNIAEIGTCWGHLRWCEKVMWGQEGQRGATNDYKGKYHENHWKNESPCTYSYHIFVLNALHSSKQSAIIIFLYINK